MSNTLELVNSSLSRFTGGDDMFKGTAYANPAAKDGPINKISLYPGGGGGEPPIKLYSADGDETNDAGLGQFFTTA